MKKLMLPLDKANHVVWGIFIYWLIGLLTNNPHYAILVVSVIAIAKEIIYDKLMKKGTPDVWDVVATIAMPLLFYITA